MNELDDGFPEEIDWGDLTDLITESEMESVPEILPIELDASSEMHINSIIEPEQSSYFNKASPVKVQVVGEQTQPAQRVQTTNLTPPTDTETPQAKSRDCSSDQKSAPKRKQTRQEHDEDLSETEDPYLSILHPCELSGINKKKGT